MIAFLLFLVIVWIALGIVGAVVHGLFYLLVIAVILFLLTLVFGGYRAGGRRSRR